MTPNLSRAPPTLRAPARMPEFSRPGRPSRWSRSTRRTTRSGTSAPSSTRCRCAASPDSTGNGTGDLRGLTSRLDYLQWLGIDCIWLLPIYESPLRDGGYDISDFMRVLPEVGDLGDFVELVEEAHRRGIRVITDLVMNHTSDQHPWFQASRSDPDGPYGDFYVWADTDAG